MNSDCRPICSESEVSAEHLRVMLDSSLEGQCFVGQAYRRKLAPPEQSHTQLLRQEAQHGFRGSGSNALL